MWLYLGIKRHAVAVQSNAQFKTSTWRPQLVRSNIVSNSNRDRNTGTCLMNLCNSDLQFTHVLASACDLCGRYSVQKFIICDTRRIVIKCTSSENDGPSYSQQLRQCYVGSNHRKDASKFYKKGVGQQNDVGSKNDASSDNTHAHQ